jgi:hypothetical protein
MGCKKKVVIGVRWERTGPIKVYCSRPKFLFFYFFHEYSTKDGLLPKHAVPFHFQQPAYFIKWGLDVNFPTVLTVDQALCDLLVREKMMSRAAWMVMAIYTC